MIRARWAAVRQRLQRVPEGAVDDRLTVARDFTIYSAGNIASLVILLGAALLVRRYIGPYAAGIWTALELVPLYATYAHFGILNAAERELPYLRGAGRLDALERLRRTMSRFVHGLAIALMLALFLAAAVLRHRLPPAAAVGLAVYGFIVYSQLISAYCMVVLRAEKRFVTLSARQGAANVLKAGLIVAGGALWDLWGIYGALAVASAIQLLLLRGALKPHVASGFSRTFPGETDLRLLRPLLRDGSVILVGAVAFDTLRNADKIVIGAALGAAPLGVYSVVALVCQGVFYLPNALAVVIYPRLQERFGRTNDTASLRRLVEVPLAILADALVVIIAGVLVIMPPVIRRWLPQYGDALPALSMMLAATYFLSLTNPPGQFLLTVRKEKQTLLLVAPCAALALAGGFAAARFGLTFVAAAIAASCFLQFILVNGLALREFVGWRMAFARLFHLTGGASLAVLTLAAVGTLRGDSGGPLPVSALMLLLACGAAAASLVKLLRHAYPAARPDN